MSRMHLRPAFQYRFRNNLKGALIFFGIMAFIFILMSVSFTVVYNGRNSSGSYSAYSFASSIALFVIGITMIREDLRLMLQNGISRRTVFLANILSALVVCTILAVAGELLLTAGQALTATFPQFYVSDLFYILYTDGLLADLPFSVHLKSSLFSFLLFACANLGGIFISLLFYRLNKVWSLIVGIGGPIFCFSVLPILLYKYRVPLSPFVQFLQSGPGALMLCLLLLSMLFAGIDFLLLRRAPVKPAK